MRPPTPPHLPLIGHIPQFRRDVLGFLVRSVETYGDFIRFKLGPQQIYLVNDPQHVLHVLKKQAANYDKDTRSTRFLSDICGESLLTMNGDMWQHRRQLLQPAFHRQAIAGFESIMRQESADLVSAWEHQPTVNASADITTTTFRIVARSLFGADIDRESLSSLAAPISRILTEAFARLGTLSGRKSRHFIEAMRQLDLMVDHVIASRTRRPDTPDLLELIRTGGGDDRDIHHESIAFLLAGHETTANALSWLLAYLAQHPDEQERCAHDADALERAFQESLRLSPPIWIIERHAITSDEIAGYTIPQDASVIVCTYTLHRHPSYWDDPERFNPDRFLQAPPPAFVPFGLGPRVCIGREFSLMEARIIATDLLSRFRFSLATGDRPQPETGITLRIKNDLILNLEHRTP